MCKISHRDRWETGRLSLPVISKDGTCLFVQNFPELPRSTGTAEPQDDAELLEPPAKRPRLNGSEAQGSAGGSTVPAHSGATVSIFKRMHF